MADDIVRRKGPGARALRHRQFLEQRDFDRLYGDDWFADSPKEAAPAVRVVVGWRTAMDEAIANARDADDRRILKLIRARARRAAWSQEERQAFRESQRKSYAKKPEYYSAMKAAWAAANQDKMAEYRKKWRANNREHELLKRREWYAKNRERLVAKSSDWAKANKEKRNALDRARALKKREAANKKKR